MIAGFRFDIFVIIWMLSMGMVNYLDQQTNVFNYQQSAKYSISQIAALQGITVGGENQTITNVNEPRDEPTTTSGYIFLDSFVYMWKLASFVGGTLWNATFGLHTYLYNHFGVDYIWGVPIMVIINLLNFLGALELWTKIKV